MKKLLSIILILSILLCAGCSTSRELTFEEKINISLGLTGCTLWSTSEYETMSFANYEERMIVKNELVNKPAIVKAECKGVRHYLSAHCEVNSLTCFTINDITITEILKSYGNDELFTPGTQIEVVQGYGYYPVDQNDYFDQEYGISLEEAYADASAQGHDIDYLIKLKDKYEWFMADYSDHGFPLDKNESYIIFFDCQEDNTYIAWAVIPYNLDKYKILYDNNSGFEIGEYDIKIRDIFIDEFMK